MAPSFEIRDGELIRRNSDGTYKGSSPKEFFDAKLKGDHPELSNTRITSFGRLKLEVDFDSEIGVAKFNVIAFADGVSVTLSAEKPLGVTYAASTDLLIPLKTELTLPIERELRPVQNQVGEISIEKLATSLIRAANGIALPIEFTETFLNELENIAPEPSNSFLDSELHEYQKRGFWWMRRLWENNLGGILGDEMGVGKTLQIMALAVSISKSAKDPALLVVPGNLLHNWCKEFATHAATVASDVYVHFGSNRVKDSSFLSSQKVILTSYSMVVQDFEVFTNLDFSVVCCDEAHDLRERRTLRSQAIKSLNARAKFLATGTPIQNRLSDFWALMDIIDPGLLGSWVDFEARCTNSAAEAEKLASQTSHRILRRTQAQVGIEIPEGQEFQVWLELDAQHTSQYKELRNDSSGFGSLSKLRQLCAHPSSLDEGPNPEAGEKAQFLKTQLRQIISLNEKAVVFVADFNSPRDLYRELLKLNFPRVWTANIDGRTPADLRHHLLEEFTNQTDSAVLLINPLVGGQGLNIVAANHVFHMNPLWNPAKTDQASFRVTRPGQTRRTWSHHLYYSHTVEEAIHGLVAEKRELSDAALRVAEEEAASNLSSLSPLLNTAAKG